MALFPPVEAGMVEERWRRRLEQGGTTRKHER
jgi:hypothetical protein